jgi:adenylate cyclase
MFNNSEGSIEDTAKLQTHQATTQEQIRQLIQRANDLVELLRSQREILRQRGMNLPTGSLDSLKQLRAQLDKLNNTLGGTLTELKQLRALAHTTSIINSSLEPAEVLNQVMDTVIQITGAERGYIALRHPDTGEMEYPVRRGIDQEQMEKGELVVSKTIVNEVATTGEAVLTENASKDDRYQGHQSIVGFQLRSILAVPLKVRNDVIGVVYCDNRIMAGLFKQHDLNLLKAFSNQAAVAIENARLFENLRLQIAETSEARDLMTNIFDSIVSGVITINPDNIISDWNTAAEQITGLEKSAVVGRVLEDVLPTLNGVFHQGLAQVRKAGSQEIMEVTPELPEMGKRCWNLVMSPLQDDTREHQGIVILVDDLTTIRQREEQLGMVSQYMKLGLEDIRDVDVLDIMGGQERIISVIHTDVRGFTTFSEKLEPEELMRVINQYLTMSSHAIKLQDGIVDKYMGDAVTGLFNTSFNPQENHAVRAVRAAMTMLSDLAYEVHSRLPEDQRLWYGIGIHTGAAVLGNVGSKDRKEFTALGDATDLAKLLQENALAGEILISQGTYDVVKDLFECEPLTPRKTKDYPDFTVMYKVVKVKKRTGPLNLDDLDF